MSNRRYFEDEQWRDVVGLPRYSVSDFGRVYDHHREKMLTQSPDRSGYLRVKLWINDVRMTVSIHRLVAFAFIGVQTSDREVNHDDGDKAYNYLGNLELMTRSQNIAHAYENDLSDVPKRTPIRCVETGVEYKSTRAAARDLGISCHKSISRVIDHPDRRVKGLTFVSISRR
jgi:hypothetical protein